MTSLTRTPQRVSRGHATAGRGRGRRTTRGRERAVAVRTDHATYPAGLQPTFTLAVRNTGTRDCRRDVGQNALELRVISGGVLVWSSDHCSPGGAPDLRTLTPGQTFTATVQWARVSSQPGCPANQPSAAAGSYSVVARDLTLVSPRPPSPCSDPDALKGEPEPDDTATTAVPARLTACEAEGAVSASSVEELGGTPVPVVAVPLVAGTQAGLRQL